MKHVGIFCLIIALIFSREVYSQTDSTAIHLEEVSVTASINWSELKKTARNVTVISWETIESAPVKTLDAVLQYALNVDIRSRTAFGVQADISIRGGHYDQTLILVDGVKMNDPQTGHHSLNLPIPFSMIDRIEVLQGGASRVFGPNAFSGAINIITKKAVNNRLTGYFSGGQYGLWRGGAHVALVKNGLYAVASYSKDISDGYMPSTEFNKEAVSLKIGADVKGGNINLSFGNMSNAFGLSNGYHPKYFNQYEEVSSQFYSLDWTQNLSHSLTLTFIGSYKNHNDMYDFDNYRDNNLWAYLNFHETGVLDLEWKLRYLSDWGKTAFGLEYRKESVLSNRLGDEISEKIPVKGWQDQFYEYQKSRDIFNGFIEQNKTLGKFNLSVGTLINSNSQYGLALFPGLDVSYELSDFSGLYYSVNRSVRYPNFTELYLNNSTVKSNLNLKSEKALAQELGLRMQKDNYKGIYSIFYTSNRDAIDKIKRPDQEVPVMENLDRVSFYGFETRHFYTFDKPVLGLSRVDFNFSWINADRKEEGYQSFYTLNYLKQKASLGVLFKPYKNLYLNAWYTLKNRAGNYSWDAESLPVPYGSFGLIDLRLGYSFRSLGVQLDINNLLNKEYYEHGFVRQPPRWISAGISIDIKND